MKRLFIFLMITCMVLPGCMGIEIKTPQEREILKLSVSVAAKALGLKLQKDITWTDELDALYRVVINGGFNLTTANMVERYIRDSVDPLVQDDIIALSKLVGFEFDTSGVVNVDKVDMELLKIAAEGLRMGIMYKK